MSQTPPEIAPESLNVEAAVKERYSAASKDAEPALCCPVDYNREFLEVLPQELIDRDYGCGDPSQYVKPGETVLDLGSGGGKICYIASQVVGQAGKVIGVDMNDDMLSLARQYQQEIGDRIGWHNVEFFKGRIQDLALDLDVLESELKSSPVSDSHGWMELQQRVETLRSEKPMIASDSIDVVVSNCVLNLVSSQDRKQLFGELKRVLKRGGRAVISDIVSDEIVPDAMQNDPKLWSGCISGAFREDQFLAAFEEAGFYGIEVVAYQSEPWATVQGIEFRSMTVCAYKGKEGPCDDHHQAVIYKGPWKNVTDDNGNQLERGVRSAVCKKTFELYQQPPYNEHFISIEPAETVTASNAKPFDCGTSALRDPKVTKGGQVKNDLLPLADCCGPGECC